MFLMAYIIAAISRQVLKVMELEHLYELLNQLMASMCCSLEEPKMRLSSQTVQLNSVRRSA